MARDGILARIFGTITGRRDAEDEAPAPPPPPPVITIDASKSQPEIIAGIRDAIARGADVNAAISNWGAPLDEACRLGLADVVSALVDAGANVNPPAGNHTPFMSAVEGLHPDIMQLLVDRGADPKQPDGIPQDAMVKYFLVHPWQQMKEPGFPARDLACLQLLLDHGLKMEDWDKNIIYTERPHLMPLAPDLYPVKELEEAAKNGEWGKVYKMIDAGLSPDAPALYGGTPPLVHAIEKDDIDALNMLLDRGANIETGTRYMTPVMHAAVSGAEKCFTRLVRAGADITKKYGDDWDGWTTLVELAGQCKTNPNMKAYAENAIQHSKDPIEVSINVDHKVKVGHSLHFKRILAPA
jgi:ankyrin repeat protein